MPQYQGVWSLQSAAQLQSTQRWVTDPLFENTTLLLQADDAPSGAQNNTFFDSSGNNFTITRNGNATQGTFAPFSLQPGAWSNFASAASASVGFSNATAALVGSTASTFTAECWIYMTDAPVSGDGVPALIGMDATFNSSIYLGFGPNASQKLVLRWFDGASKTATGNTTLALNTWYHIAVVANSNALAMYVNGVPEVLTGTTTLTNRNGTTNTFSLFLNSSVSNYQFRGYASNIRVCTAAVYTSAFTPSTSPLTTTSQGATNCRLLTSQNNLFIDNSSNAYTLTLQGAPSVQAFSPFAPQYQWTSSVIGGSGYFDGSGDSISVSSTNTLFNIGASVNFTYEAWFYSNSAAAILNIISLRQDGSGWAAIEVQTNTNRTISLNIAQNAGSWAIGQASTATFNLNSWNHVAVVRTGGSTINLYLNGVSILGPFTNGNALYSTPTEALRVASRPTGGNLTGYVAGVRFIRGQALATGNFTPPTAPVTPTTVGWTGANAAASITGTVVFLCNFSNAAIYDGTMKNVLETVGNAQISTAVVKYGSGSMYFDGTGDYLVIPKRPYFDFPGDFTIEFWLYVNSLASYSFLMDTRSSISTFWLIDLTTAGVIGWGPDATIRISSSAITTGQWYHVAISRLGASTRMFLNGTQTGSTYTSSASITAGTTSLVIAGSAVNLGTSNANVYMDDIRISTGIARYTANFIPPSVALPRQ